MASKNIATICRTLVLLAFFVVLGVLAANAQTKINAVTLIKPGGTSTFMLTNAAGAVEWNTAATLLSGGTAITITGNTVAYNPTTLTALGATADVLDELAIYDVSASLVKKVTVDDILQAHTITISDGTNTQQLKNGNTFLFNSTGTDGFDFTVSATDRVTFSYDYTEFTNLLSIDNAADRIEIFDASAGTYQYITPSQIAGSTYSFTLSDGTNTQAIDNGNTLLVNDASNGIDATVGATDNLTIDLDINELVTDAAPDYAADFIPTYDASAGFEKKVLLSTLVGASENNVSIVSNTAANTNIASGLTLSGFRYLQVFLDGVKQRQTTDWVSSGNNIQFTFATLAGQLLTVVGFK